MAAVESSGNGSDRHPEAPPPFKRIPTPPPLPRRHSRKRRTPLPLPRDHSTVTQDKHNKKTLVAGCPSPPARSNTKICARGRQNARRQPANHAGGRGSCNTGDIVTVASRAPPPPSHHLSQSLNPPPSAPPQRVDNPPTRPRVAPENADKYEHGNTNRPQPFWHDHPTPCLRVEEEGRGIIPLCNILAPAPPPPPLFVLNNGWHRKRARRTERCAPSDRAPFEAPFIPRSLVKGRGSGGGWGCESVYMPS